jgi:large subunit ribosomal protein L18
MADSPNYETHLRRRREGHTNYDKRLEMLKSGKHRAVVRISNTHACVQFVAYNPDGDETATTAVSKHLAEYGWDAHTGNLPAAYLTGFLAGKRALAAGIGTAVPDIGAKDQQYEGRYYAALKGVQDAGVDISIGDETLPSEERLQGAHAAAHESNGIDETFDDVRDAIVEEYGDG